MTSQQQKRKWPRGCTKPKRNTYTNTVFFSALSFKKKKKYPNLGFFFLSFAVVYAWQPAIKQQCLSGGRSEWLSILPLVSHTSRKKENFKPVAPPSFNNIHVW